VEIGRDQGGKGEGARIRFRQALTARTRTNRPATSASTSAPADMRLGLRQQDLTVGCDYWPLFRYNPAMREIGENRFRLDLPPPTIGFRKYAYNRHRYIALAQSWPQEAVELLAMA
jgi:hypothetical protein